MAEQRAGISTTHPRTGRWWPGLQSAWRLLDDDRGWLAEVEYSVDYDWGRGKHLAGVPAERLRVRDDQYRVEPAPP